MHLNHRLEPESAIKNDFVDCYLTHTTLKTKEIVLKNIGKMPNNFDENGKEALPPRYCPSIETKYRRFEHHEIHQIWLEPESITNNIVFPGGLATSLPPEIQQ